MVHRTFYIFVCLFAAFSSLQAQNNQLDSLTKLIESRRKVSSGQTGGMSTNTKSYTVPDPKPYGDMITTGEMDAMITKIASDEMQGRETGTEGQLIAANYIAAHFDSLGLKKIGDKGDYFQYFHLENEKWNTLEVELSGEVLRNLRDYYAIPKQVPADAAFNQEQIHYVGYGNVTANYSDYKRAKVKGKVVLVQGGSDLVDSVARKLDRLTSTPEKKAEIAARFGATAMIFIDPDYDENIAANRSTYAGYGWSAKSDVVKMSSIPILYLSPKRAATLLAGHTEKVDKKNESSRFKKSSKPVVLPIPFRWNFAKMSRTLDGSNVVGYLEGSDPILSKEVLAITAHYDHLGLHNGLIHNGADDNASGTAGVMEMAESFVAATKAGFRPKRSILFMLVSGEEKGLLGSEFYTQFPIIPLENTVCNINTDMIGRVDEIHKDNPNYIYVIGADRLSTDLHNINEEMNKTYTKMDLDYRFNAIDDPNHYYERSDHYNFAKNGVPSIFYFNGVHADYHKATDTADKIDAKMAAIRTQLAFYTAWEIANRPYRIYADKKGK
jgi:Peptidase family M28/PA domain